MNTQMLIVLALGTIISFSLFIYIFSGDDPSTAMKKRLGRVSGSVPLKDLRTAQSASSLRRRTSDSEIALLDKIIKSTLPNPDKLRQRLARTGKNTTLGEYVSINVMLILFFYLVFAFGIGSDKTIACFAAISLGLYVPHMVTGKMGDRRVRKFLSMFPEAIDTICRGLRSGLPITETIATVGHELPDPIGIEFRRISDGVRMGRSLEESMWDIAKRLDTPEFRFFIIALAIQRETGGNLAETLGNLGDLLRKRRQLKLKIRAMSSEARASAMIIGSLPFLMFSLLMAINSEYMMILLNDTTGQFLMGGGLTWLGMGVLVMKQLINFEI
ncbi:MAG: type II secretion system F family protein [Proteobacteria bacterium]|jgi:tight adherence protein B|nr:type II secretion system F family protein [Alphaproteobacteria bacterium]NCC04103.1 type II secretion system F family protein [Pseudomonadota bacterium]